MVEISNRNFKSILTTPSGFTAAYDYTLNPYSGCTFGCTYCYAAFFARDEDLMQRWGQWVEVKANALELLQKHRRKPMIGTNIYMSSVTDPYQPIERHLQLTRSILRELLDQHDVNLVVQTRGTLVMRDIDLLRQFRNVQVNMTITTGDESVRRAFEPTCASTDQRLDAITQIAEVGLNTSITMSPLLPVTDAKAFAQRLLATGVPRFAISYFHLKQRRFAAGTGAEAKRILAHYDWDHDQYRRAKAVLEARLPLLMEGMPGFMPPWMDNQAAKADQIA